MKFLTYSCVLLAVAAAYANPDKKAVVAQVVNNSASEVTIQGHRVKAGAAKATLCEVPFVSFKAHRAEFVLGRAYTPATTCKVAFKDAHVFNIWRDERGFVGAFERAHDLVYEDSVPKKLLSFDDAARIMRVVVAIDAQGKVVLKSGS